MSNVNDIDLDKIDLVTLKKLADAASEKFRTRKQDELKNMVADFLAQAKAIGYSSADVLAEIKGRGASASAGGKRGRPPGPTRARSPRPSTAVPTVNFGAGAGSPPTG